MTENPYLAPKTIDPVNEVPLSNVEVVRKEHLQCEASVKSIAGIYWLGGFFLLLFGVGRVSVLSHGFSFEGFFWSLIPMVLGVFQFWMGFSIRRLKKNVKAPLLVFSVIGLLGFPLGTIINIYILFLVLSKKGKMVFSDEYKEVIRETPHIKYKTSKAMKFFLGVIVISCIGALVYSLRL